MDTKAPSKELSALRERAEAMLAEAVASYRPVADRFEVPYQHTCVIVHPIDWSRGRTILRIIAPILRDVDADAALYARLADLNNTAIFGKFYVLDGTIFVEHNLLGESVDREQFRAVLAAIAHQADHLADPLQLDFGGKKWRGTDASRSG